MVMFCVTELLPPLALPSPSLMVMLMVRGGVGLETDPGEFSAIPVVVGESGS